MAPKAANPEGADPTSKFIFSVLKHCEQIKPDWDKVASENGIGYPRNAQAKFKTMVKNLGFQFEAGRIIVPGEVDIDAGNSPAKTPTAPKATETPKSTGTGKRKATALDGDAGNETPTKAGRKKKTPSKSGTVVKDEVNDESVIEVTNGISTSQKKKPVAALTTDGGRIKNEPDAEEGGDEENNDGEDMK